MLGGEVMHGRGDLPPVFCGAAELGSHLAAETVLEGGKLHRNELGRRSRGRRLGSDWEGGCDQHPDRNAKSYRDGHRCGGPDRQTALCKTDHVKTFAYARIHGGCH